MGSNLTAHRFCQDTGDQLVGPGASVLLLWEISALILGTWTFRGRNFTGRNDLSRQPRGDDLISPPPGGMAVTRVTGSDVVNYLESPVNCRGATVSSREPGERVLLAVTQTPFTTRALSQDHTLSRGPLHRERKTKEKQRSHKVMYRRLPPQTRRKLLRADWMSWVGGATRRGNPSPASEHTEAHRGHSHRTSQRFANRLNG
ncbi:hypothetical protein SKAU_G00075920 [Synaphobranchus kaupii]|uniref:Uncharacterized protein n=1 Tax=Synaphobranchus kaupii TaxID=118154 RepID=A0A9Q1JC71_SYNKA|nr:hypothetical protein SKAU_G00075920 [Synaphobranchus kaupii]